MRIPLGNFGLRGPDPVQHSRASGDGIDAAARAGQQLGAVAVGVGAGMVADQRAEDEALARARAGNALLDREIQIKTLHADLEQRLIDGSLHHGEAVNAYRSALNDLELPSVEGLDPVGAENYQNGLKRIEFAGLAGVQQAAEKAKRVEFKSQTDGALDRFGKLAGMPGADIEKINGQVEALDPLGQVAYGANWGKLKQDFRDRNWTNQATQRAMQGRDNMPALQQLESDLTAADGFYAGKLDPDKRNAILRTVMGDRQRLEAKIAHEADRRDARAERVIGEIDRQIASGVPASAEMWVAWSDAVKGTPFAADLQKRIDEETEVQKVLRMPIDQQLAFVQKREATMIEGGGTIREQANLNRMKGAIEANIKQIQEAPLLFNQSRTGEPVEPLDFAAFADPKQAGKIGAQMRDRVATITAMQKEYGPQVAMRPLLPQEARLLTSALGTGSPRQQSELFGSLRRAIGDDGAYMAAMQQIAPDAPVKALAGMLQAKQRKITLENNFLFPDVVSTSGDVSQTLLEGESILNKTKGQKAEDGKAKGFPLPPERDFRDQFSGIAGLVFAGRPQAFEIAAQAVRSYYTGKAAQDGDVSGEIDGTRMKHAVAAVLGEVVNYNGNGEVLAPWGMDKSTFKDKTKEAFRTELKTRGMPETALDTLPALGLRNKGDGSYYVVQGRGYLIDPKGNPVVININQDQQALQ